MTDPDGLDGHAHMTGSGRGDLPLNRVERRSGLVHLHGPVGGLTCPRRSVVVIVVVVARMMSPYRARRAGWATGARPSPAPGGNVGAAPGNDPTAGNCTPATCSDRPQRRAASAALVAG